MVFLDTIAPTAAASGRVSNRAFMDGALRPVNVALCQGNGRMYTEALQTLVRSHGRMYILSAEVAVPCDGCRVDAGAGRRLVLVCVTRAL
jgi:hypothetical protein